MRGRPVKSQIRNNIIEILAVKKKAYGYDIYRHYTELFPKVHIRSIYYHLKKGVELKEINVHEVKEEQGNYSWGPKAEKTYYSLGPEAVVKGRKKVKKYFDKIRKV